MKQFKFFFSILVLYGCCKASFSYNFIIKNNTTTSVTIKAFKSGSIKGDSIVIKSKESVMFGPTTSFGLPITFESDSLVVFRNNKKIDSHVSPSIDEFKKSTLPVERNLYLLQNSFKSITLKSTKCSSLTEFTYTFN
jgi:hypothetical protein